MRHLLRPAWSLAALVAIAAFAAPAEPPVLDPVRPARMTKVLVDWSQIEPTRGALNWQSADARMKAAGGSDVVAVVAHTPLWASYAKGQDRASPMIWSRQPPKDLAAWEAFVRRAAQRYRGKVRAWQIWTPLSLPSFRGTTQDYLGVLRAARRAIRAADPAARVAASAPPGVDLPYVRRLLTTEAQQFDALALAPLGMLPEDMIRPLGALRTQLLGRTPKALWVEWDPRTVERPERAASLLVRFVAVARALGADATFWAGPWTGDLDRAADVLRRHLGAEPAGYLRRPGALAVVFGTSAAVWAPQSRQVAVPVGGAAAAFAASGERVELSVRDGVAEVTAGPDPIVVEGLAPSAVAEARQAASARPALPPIEGEDLSARESVAARLGATNVEQGLYNARYRSRRNGALVPVEVDGESAVRTDVRRDAVYAYFDVDDTFLFFNNGRFRVEVTVEVRGASAPGRAGFNLFYDSDTGYRFTPWQPVEVRDGWVRYTVALDDANFGNTWGWDFAINAAGSRGEELVLRSVTVRKISRR